MNLGPVSPSIPSPLREFLGEARTAIVELAEPTYPHRVFACAAADLPAASDYPHCLAINTTTQKLVCSTWDGAQWEWLTCDGGAL